MRVVSSSARPALGPDDESNPEILGSVRDLGGRFPAARLRQVPVIRAADLDVSADPSGNTRVWLALEAMQITGSFKVRGALTALAHLGARRPPPARIVTASAGNHGAGVAYAARVLGLHATVVMPKSVPRAKRSRVEAHGAEILLAPSDHYDDAEAFAKKLSADRGAVFLSPYDDPYIVAGNGASLGFEIVRALGGVPEIVLAPFGGGGLATGLSWAMRDESGERADGARHVWGVQSEVSPAMALSLEKGEAVERFVPEKETLAEGLEGGISARAFARARRAIGGVVVVSETDIAAAMAYAHREMGLVLEGSAATALVPILKGLPAGLRAPSQGGIDVVAVLTGRNVDPERLESTLGVASVTGTGTGIGERGE